MLSAVADTSTVPRNEVFCAMSAKLAIGRCPDAQQRLPAADLGAAKQLLQQFEGAARVAGRGSAQGLAEDEALTAHAEHERRRRRFVVDARQHREHRFR